jgi:hypothetical protein
LATIVAHATDQRVPKHYVSSLADGNMHNRRPHLIVCLLLEFISCTWGMSIDLDQIDPDVESAIAPSVQRTSAAPKTANQ